MKKIYKYTCNVFNEPFKIPGFIKILSVEEQNETIVFYVLVDTDSTDERIMEYEIIGTGHPIKDDIIENFNFIGTIKFQNGALMFHAFAKVT